MRQGGVWRNIQQLWIRQGGVWRKVLDFTIPIPSLALSDKSLDAFANNPGIAQVRFFVKNNGRVALQQGIGSAPIEELNEWFPTTLNSAQANNYECKFDLQNGLQPSGPAFGVWHSLDVTLELVFSRSGNGAISCAFATTIREKTNTANFVSATVFMNCEVEP